MFHNPNDPSQNYIKRLVALPNETIELKYGNVTINGQIARKPDKAQDALWMLVHDTRYQPQANRLAAAVGARQRVAARRARGSSWMQGPRRRLQSPGSSTGTGSPPTGAATSS